MDTEVKKLEDKIKEDFLRKKTRVIRQDAYDHDGRFKAYYRKLISLMPWIGPHITKRVDQGSALQMVKCTMLTVTINGGYFLGNIMDDRMKLHMGGATTCLDEGSKIVVIQAVERKRETINYFSWELRNVGDAHRSKESQGLRPCMGDCAPRGFPQK